ncbi:hypothetical protein AGMMS49992_21120 [Clostridia bacterium]|nr:hypothetical protein AGMMS49992_21120 [Clostridia bacterium]
MHIILLSGGSGKRLWPLSTSIRPKQFIKLLTSPTGHLESMVQRVYRQIREADLSDSITIATNTSQVALLREQVGYNIDIVEEPFQKDTFPAIALSCCYLTHKRHVPLNETVAILPIDQYCGSEYYQVIRLMNFEATSDFADIMLMGIQPDKPSTKYGYIVPEKDVSGIKEVKKFVEKPTEFKAIELIKEGALWNSGVFVFKLGYLIDMMKISSYDEMYDNYGSIEKTSFDYAIVQRSNSLGVVNYNGFWEDLGTWNVLTEQLDKPIIGNVIVGGGTNNTSIINELGIPIVALGISGLVVIASSEGILITDKMTSVDVKSLVD